MSEGMKERASQVGKSSSRDKEEHIRICLERNVESFQTTGFENYYLVNNPLPEVDFDEVDTSCSFLGKPISAPIIISPMTGGCGNARKINRNLALAAQRMGVVMAVGSQRLGIEHPSLARTYEVRDVASDIPLLANLGAVYLNYGYGLEECRKAVEMIGADALILYLNPVQKVFQGNRKLDFGGIIKRIAHICENLSVPVIVKEVGFGISGESARILRDLGVNMIDVAGAGGTSWVKITRMLNSGNSEESRGYFDSWGIPTAEALISVLEVARDIPIIASGGIRSGMQVAKALALGAHYSAMALPFLEPATKSAEAVEEKIGTIIWELKVAMFCCGAPDLNKFKKGGHIRRISC